MDNNSEKWRKGYAGGQRSILRSNAAEYHRRLQALDAFSLPPEARILDFGCGGGELTDLLTARGYRHVVGVDTDSALLAPRRPDPRFVHYNGAQLPFDDASFDAVISMAVLHHIEARAGLPATLAEIRRVLKPGGFFLCMEPANTLARRLLTPLLLSPLAEVFEFSRRKKWMVLEERDLLDSWLAREPRFASDYLLPLGFRLNFARHDFLRVFVSAEKVPPNP